MRSYLDRGFLHLHMAVLEWFHHQGEKLKLFHIGAQLQIDNFNSLLQVLLQDNVRPGVFQKYYSLCEFFPGRYLLDTSHTFEGSVCSPRPYEGTWEYLLGMCGSIAQWYNKISSKGELIMVWGGNMHSLDMFIREASMPPSEHIISLGNCGHCTMEYAQQPLPVMSRAIFFWYRYLVEGRLLFFFLSVVRFSGWLDISRNQLREIFHILYHAYHFFSF